MKWTTIICLFCSILFTPVIQAQTPTQLLNDYVTSFHTEKIYISHNQPYYATGETIWCKAYLVDGESHQFFSAKPIVYVDWVSPKGTILKTLNLQIVDGTTTFDIPTEKNDQYKLYIKKHLRKS